MSKSTKVKGWIIAILFFCICIFLSCGNQTWESPRSATELPAIIPDSISGDSVSIIDTDSVP